MLFFLARKRSPQRKTRRGDLTGAAERAPWPEPSLAYTFTTGVRGMGPPHSWKSVPGHRRLQTCPQKRQPHVHAFWTFRPSERKICHVEGFRCLPAQTCGHISLIRQRTVLNSGTGSRSRWAVKQYPARKALENTPRQSSLKYFCFLSVNLFQALRGSSVSCVT